MSKKHTIADYHPVGMSECDSNCIFGNCGENCPIYVQGDCVPANEELMDKQLSDMSATKHLEVD